MNPSQPKEDGEYEEMALYNTAREAHTYHLAENANSARGCLLPLATQNFQQLLALSSGTAPRLNNVEQLGRGDVRIFVSTQPKDYPWLAGRRQSFRSRTSPDIFTKGVRSLRYSEQSQPLSGSPIEWAQ